jgi:Ca2+-binding EF-hand superfamily protein
VKKCAEYDIVIPSKLVELCRLKEMLGLSWHDIDRVNACFNIIDSDRDGNIDVGEFIDFVGESPSDFALALFHLVDRDANRKIDFAEFLGAAARICCADHNMICRLAFRMIDQDGSGTLSFEELKHVIKIVYGQNTINDEGFGGSNRRSRLRAPQYKRDVNKALGLMESMDVDTSKSLSVHEFCGATLKCPQLLEPAFDLQRLLQQKIVNRTFWAQRAPKLRARYNTQLQLVGGTLDTHDWWGIFANLKKPPDSECTKTVAPSSAQKISPFEPHVRVHTKTMMGIS